MPVQKDVFEIRSSEKRIAGWIFCSLVRFKGIFVEHDCDAKESHRFDFSWCWFIACAYVAKRLERVCVSHKSYRKDVIHARSFPIPPVQIFWLFKGVLVELRFDWKCVMQAWFLLMTLDDACICVQAVERYLHREKLWSRRRNTQVVAIDWAAICGRCVSGFSRANCAGMRAFEIQLQSSNTGARAHAHAHAYIFFLSVSLSLTNTLKRISIYLSYISILLLTHIQTHKNKNKHTTRKSAATKVIATKHDHMNTRISVESVLNSMHRFKRYLRRWVWSWKWSSTGPVPGA